jgi:hypothetical protein
VAHGFSVPCRWPGVKQNGAEPDRVLVSARSPLQAQDDNPLIREGDVLSRRSADVHAGVTKVVAGFGLSPSLLCSHQPSRRPRRRCARICPGMPAPGRRRRHLRRKRQRQRHWLIRRARRPQGRARHKPPAGGDVHRGTIPGEGHGGGQRERAPQFDGAVFRVPHHRPNRVNTSFTPVRN